MRILPWKSRTEFETLRENLFNFSSQEKGQHVSLDKSKLPKIVEGLQTVWYLSVFTFFTFYMKGLYKICIWFARGKVPQSVDLTYSLFCALLSCINLQKVYENGSGQDDASDPLLASECSFQYTRQSVLALSFIRFVNGLLDPLQLEENALPLIPLALKLKMPVTFVEVRHACTHEEMPSYEYLYEMTIKALEWLYLHYWSKPTMDPVFMDQEDKEANNKTDEYGAELSGYKARLEALKNGMTRANDTNINNRIHRWQGDYKISQPIGYINR